MDELVAFVTARLDEDEAAAKAAGGLNWEYRDSWVWAGLSSEVADVYGIPDIDETGIHIARHDPARVLREVAAGRALIAIAEDVAEDAEQHGYDLPEGVNDGRDPDERVRDEAVGDARVDLIGDVLRVRAAVHSDHPDYRPEWKP